MANNSKRRDTVVALPKRKQIIERDLQAEKAQIVAEIEALRSRHPATWDIKQLVRQASKESQLAKKFKEISEDESEK